MDNNQYQPISPYYATTANKPSGKLKLLIIGLIAAAVIGLVLLVIFIIGKNQNASILPAGKENSATLQIYAALEDEISADQIESIVKSIDGSAVVSIEDGYGTIKIPSETEELISFNFATEEESSPASDEYLEEDDYAEKVYAPNTAYAFTFIVPLNEEDAITISYSDQGIFYYYDGLDVYEFPTKQEAIDAYLAPVFEDLE